MGERLFLRSVRLSILGISLTCLAVCLLSSCKPGIEVVREVHYENDFHTDSVLHTDSVIKEKKTIIREADSAMLDELGIKLKQGERAILVLQRELERMRSDKKEVIHDSIVKQDSIPQIVEVEKELSWFDKKKMQLGELAMYIMVGLSCIVVVRYIIKKTT